MFYAFRLRPCDSLGAFGHHSTLSHYNLRISRGNPLVRGAIYVSLTTASSVRGSLISSLEIYLVQRLRAVLEVQNFLIVASKAEHSTTCCRIFSRLGQDRRNLSVICGRAGQLLSRIDQNSAP